MFIMILTIAVIVGLLQPVCGLRLATSKRTHHSGGNDSMALRLDKLQDQMVQQNKTLEMQEETIRELKQEVSDLKGSISLKHRETANQIHLLTNTLSAVSQSISTFLLLEHRNKNQLSKFSRDLNTTQNRLSLLQGTVSQNQQQVSSLTSQYSAMSLNMSALSSDLQSVKSSLRSLQTTVSRNRQYSSSHISFLTNRYSTVSQQVSSLSSQYSAMSLNLSSLSSDLQSVESSLSSLQTTVYRNRQYSSSSISSLSGQYSAMSSNLSTLSSDLQSVESRLSSLQTTVSRNQQYSSGETSSLANQYSDLSTTLEITTIRDSTLEHNGQETVITGTRITGGSHFGMGRLEVSYRGHWGTVCDDGFGSNSAKVACRQLGYPWTHAIARGSAHFGPGSGDIVLDDVQCRGDESSIALCRHAAFGEHNCVHDEDVGVVCLEIRLVNGSSQNEGRVEIKLGNTWGTVCDDDWSSNDARVVCKMLGYNGTAQAFSDAQFGPGSGPIWLDDVDCTGSESSIALCPSRGFGNHDCGHHEDAGVICH